MRERARSIKNTTDFLITPTMYAPLETSLVLRKGTGDPTWSRATKAWGFNELGYLEELASGCAFFGGARLVYNLLKGTEDSSNVAWWKSTGSTGAQTTDSSGGNTALRFSYTSSQSHLVYQYQSATSCKSTYCFSFKFKTDSTHDWWRAMVYDGSVNQCRVWFNAQTGVLGSIVQNVSAVINAVTLTDEGGGWFTLAIIGSPNVATLGVYAQIGAHDADGSTAITTVGAGDAITIEKPSLVDVTGYDSSYVPEYVSVGVVSSPFFGAGIDGAKYFSTDYTGGRALTNLIGLRKEQAATNNLLHGRDLSNAVWQQTGVSGAEILVNGSFVADTDWSKTAGWAIGSGQATCTANGSNQAISQAAGDSYVSGNKYVLQYTVVSNTLNAGTLRVGGYSGSSGFGVSPTAIPHTVGSQATVITGNPTGAGVILDLWVNGASSGTLVIDNVSIKLAAVQCSKTATGIDGVANTATTLTASAAGAIILQPITLASAARCASAYVKRRTGTGTISFTQDGGSTWTDITSQINSSTWSRVQITATLANPSVGFKISTSGDAIDVDCVQNEAGAVATSPIVTTTAAVTRNADSLAYQTASNWSDTAGTAYIEAQPLSWVAGGAIGSATNGLLLSAANSGATASDGTNTANGPTGTPGTSEKLALNWTGAVMEVASSATVGTPGTYDGAMGLSNIGIGVGASGYFKNVAVYPYALSDADMVKITT